MNNHPDWKTAELNFRYVKEGINVPAMRRQILLTTPHGGIIRYDLNRLQVVDARLGRLNDSETLLGGRTREVLLLKQPGSEASRSEALAAIVMDEAGEAESVRRDLRQAITVLRTDEVIKLQSASQALVVLIGSAINDGDLNAAAGINLYLGSLLDESLASAGQVTKSRTVDAAIAPSAPERAAVLALERVLRSTVDKSDDLAIEAVERLMLSLAGAAVYRPNSSALEHCLVRTEVIAQDYRGTPAVNTAANLLADLGRLAFLANRSSAQSMARMALERLFVSLSAKADMGDEAQFCVDRFAEMLAAAMHADYFAYSHVLRGASKLADIHGETNNSKSRYAAAISLVELGGAAFATGRFSLALQIAQLAQNAGNNLEASVRSISRRSIATSLQFRSDLSGEVFGEDVEATAKRYVMWVSTLATVS